MALQSAPYRRGETITLHRRAGFSGRTTYGAEIPIWLDVEVRGVFIWPAGTSEDTSREDLVEVDLSALVPPSAEVGAGDEVTIGGDRYRVVGQPIPWNGGRSGSRARAIGTQLSLAVVK